MRAKIAIAVSGLALAATPVAGGAPGHDTPWYWNRYKAEATLLEDGVEWADGTYSEVSRAACLGRGDSMRSKTPGKPWPLYRHFRCYGRAYDEVDGITEFSVLLHVTGKFTYVLTA
jgi:hypothetical protein